MNKRFMIHTITAYHINNDNEVMKQVFNTCYFRHNNSSNIMEKGVLSNSTGTIIIPTEEDIMVFKDDIIIEKVVNLSNNLAEELSQVLRDNTIQKFRVKAIEDNRKGNLKHFKLIVGD